MTSLRTGLTVSSAVLTLGLGIGVIDSAQAATIPSGYNIEVSIDPAPAGGVLAGETYSGSFLINDTGFTGVGEEFLPVFNLMFAFEGTVYTEADADAPPEALFEDGVFLGLGYSVTASPLSFAFVQGFSSVDDAVFVYFDDTSLGFGDITYTEIPEPLTLLGTMTAIGFGTYFKRKRKN